MPFKIKFGKLLKRGGIKAAELSRKTGISPANISRYLSGKMEPDKRNLITLAKFFKVSPEYFMEQEEGQEDQIDLDLDKNYKDKYVKCLERENELLREIFSLNEQLKSLKNTSKSNLPT